MADENHNHIETPPKRLTSEDTESQTTQISTPKAENAGEPESKKSRVPAWLYVLYKIFRIILVPLLCILALYIGLRIGYSTIGGEDPSDVLDPSTWTHLFDLIFKD